jgi:hypothetical protein
LRRVLATGRLLALVVVVVFTGLAIYTSANQPTQSEYERTERALHEDQARRDVGLTQANMSTDTMPAEDVGFLFLDDAKTYYKLERANDLKAMTKLFSERSETEHVLVRKGEKITVEKRLPDVGGNTWYCMRPSGEPDCLWFSGPAIFGNNG